MPETTPSQGERLPISDGELTQMGTHALILVDYDILRNDGDEVLFQIPCKLTEPSEGACFHYAGGPHGLLWKNAESVVICTDIHPEIRRLLVDQPVIYACEGNHGVAEEDDIYFARVLDTPNTNEVIDLLMKRLTDLPKRQISKQHARHDLTSLPTPNQDTLPMPESETAPAPSDDAERVDSMGEDSAASIARDGPVCEFRFGTLLWEDPKAEEVQHILEDCRRLVGAAPFKAYMEEWARMRPLLRPFRTNPEGPVEHLLFAIEPGSGCSKALRLLSRLMAVDGPFGGRESPYGEICKLDEQWLPDEYAGVSDLDIDTKQFADGLHDEAPGILGLHMPHWLDKLHTPQFARILDACARLRHRIQFVFIIPFVDPGMLSRVHTRLSDQLNVRIIPFPPHTDEELTRMARERFRLYGYAFDTAAEAAFARLLRAERHDLRFYGIRTAHKLVTELLLKKLRQSARPQAAPARNPNPDAMVLHAEDFLDPSPDEMPTAPSGFSRLDELEGLQSIKRRLREIVGALQVQRAAHERGEDGEPPCLHMLFTGPPGTGKTEVARILGQILRECRLLPQGDLIEATRFDLVGQYIGQTGPQTIALCRSAIGSILFVDEAYLLASGNGDGDNGDFGREALGALIAEMENNRGRLMVILAGYREEMEFLFQMNPGLRDRVPHHLHFEPYDRDVLSRIAIRQLRKGQLVSPEASVLVENHFKSLSAGDLMQRDFGNARYVRNLTERIRMKAMVRLGQTFIPLSGAPDIQPIDVESALAELNRQQDGPNRAPRRFGF